MTKTAWLTFAKKERITCTSDGIKDECALKHKEEYPMLAKVLYQLSEEEMEHANRLHDVGVNIISNYRQQNGEPPKEMQIIYDYEHERQIEMAKGIRIMQGMYKA